MKKKYFAPEVEVVKFAPEILDVYVTSVGTSGNVDNDDTGSGHWDFGGDNENPNDGVGAKGANLWDGWDD